MTIDDLIKEYFDPQEKESLDLGNLINMINEEVESFHGKMLLKEEKEVAKAVTGKEFLLSLPKFTPTEAWGQPNSEARQQIDLFIRQIPGPATLEKKIQYLRNLQEPKGKITSARRIISTLVILESLASVLNSFTDASAGFVFEGFLAALLGGYQVSEPTGAGLPIEDIVAFKYKEADPGVPMSLKLLKPRSKIKGSYSNLMVAMQNYPKGMKYVVATKEGEDEDAISIQEFMVTRDNVIDMLLAGTRNNRNLMGLSPKVRKAFKLSQTTDSVDLLRAILQRRGWDEFFEVVQYTEGFNSNVRGQLQSLKDEERGVEDRGNLDTPDWMLDLEKQGILTRSKPPEQEEPEEEEAAQLSEWAHYIPEPFSETLLNEGASDKGWLMSQPQLRAAVGAEGEHVLGLQTIGVLDVSQESLFKTADMYVSGLNDQITVLFQSVKDLSDNLNQFFVDKNRQNALGSGVEAIDNAKTIEKVAAEEVEKEVADPEEEN